MCSKSQGFYGLNSTLSRASQAVEAAILKVASVPGLERRRIIAAAALRAAANQAHPKAHIENIAYTHQNYVDGWKDALDVILGISDELESQP